jgi:hypothetical protein
LTLGSELAVPVFDSKFVKLLDAGASIDQHLLERLAALGITEVLVESTVPHIVRRPTRPLPAGVHVRPGGFRPEQRSTVAAGAGPSSR